MTTSKKSPPSAASRVKRHRRRAAQKGIRRIEIQVPACDAAALRTLARLLRQRDGVAARTRQKLSALVGEKPAPTGKEVLEFFRRSPLVGLDLDFERDPTLPRPVEL